MGARGGGGIRQWNIFIPGTFHVWLFSKGSGFLFRLFKFGESYTKQCKWGRPDVVVVVLGEEGEREREIEVENFSPPLTAFLSSAVTLHSLVFNRAKIAFARHFPAKTPFYFEKLNELRIWNSVRGNYILLMEKWHDQKHCTTDVGSSSFFY